MKWRMTGNVPARATLNRASIWADWEKRPPPGGAGTTSGRRGAKGRHRGKQSSRPQSFFGFMSMVGGSLVGGSGATKIVSPTGSPRK